jgi:diguanylate cyclase
VSAERPSELELLRAVVETQRAINARSHEPQHVMAVVAERSQLLTAADGAVVELLEGDEMVYRAVCGSAEGTLGLRLKAATSLSGRCVAEREPLRCDDSETDERVDREACRRVGVRSMIVVPLLLEDGRCVGVLKVLSGREAAFDELDVGTLATMGAFIATSLQHAAEFEDRDRRAFHDSLTGLPNRTALLDRLATALARSARNGEPVTVAFLDLDGFKGVNDTLGHDAGDRLLVAVAERLLAAVRAEDTVARLGGDEFVAVAERLGSPEVSTLIARLAVAVKEAWTGEPAVDASIGIARSIPGDTAEVLLARADEAMYSTKRARR